MLSDLIDLLREKGVKSLTWGDVSLELAEEPAKSVSSVDNKPESRKLIKEGVLGKDGFTAAEQLEVYGEVMDAVPPVYEE